MRKVAVVGPMPPPIHGMSKNLKIFFEDVSDITDVIAISTSPGTIVKGLRYHVSKLLRVVGGVLSFLGYCLRQKVKSLYLPPDAGFGAYYSLAFVFVARMFGVPIYLHHRSFLYVNRKTLGMALIYKVSGCRSKHIFLCEKMKADFEALYGPTNSTVVSNAHYVSPVQSINENEGPVVIGFLSNLGFEKGVSRVFDVCSKLASEGVDFRLRLAGPPENSEVEQYLEEKLREFAGLVDYVGFVSGKEKDDFYRSLDVFLFPTLYRNEAQPNVLFEAAAKGAAVFSLDVGCIASDFGCESGRVYNTEADFAEHAPRLLAELSEDRDTLNDLRRSSLRKMVEAQEASRAAYDDLIRRVSDGIL